MWLAAVAVVIGLDTYLLTEKNQMPLNPGDFYFNDQFNDATRILEGGLWQQNPVDGGQAPGNLGRYTTDIKDVQTGLNTLLGTLTTDGHTAINAIDQTQVNDINNILTDIDTILTKAPLAANDADPNAAEAVREAHLDILKIVNGDAALHDNATGSAVIDGDTVTVNGFQNAPPASDHAASLPHDTFAQIGAIFDDAQSLSLAGGTQNKDAIVADLTTARDAMMKLIDGGAFTDPTASIHAQKIVNCFNLELTKYIPEYGHDPEAARSTNDVFLDLDDIVNGDPILTQMATENGVQSWTPAPDTNELLHPASPYQDNPAQTNFLASFIAGANTLGAQADAIAQQGFNHGLVKAFENVLDGFEANVQKFDEKQGGIYEARFDNELEGNFGTIGAAIKGIEQGLNTHNADLVTAGVTVLEDNAADVGTNNVPVGGGTYSTAATTAAGAVTGAVDTHLAPHGDNGIAHAIGVHAHGNNAQGHNGQMGGENGAAAGAVNTHLILQAMTGTANVNDAHLGGENGAAAGAVDTHLVSHEGNGIDHSIGVDHLHHATTETIGLFHG
jgi:hypothetical protein